MPTTTYSEHPTPDNYNCRYLHLIPAHSKGTRDGQGKTKRYSTTHRGTRQVRGNRCGGNVHPHKQQKLALNPGSQILGRSTKSIIDVQGYVNSSRQRDRGPQDENHLDMANGKDS